MKSILKLFLIIPIFFISIVTIVFSLNSPDIKPPQKKIQNLTKTQSGKVELCLSCHLETLDNFHKREIFGCSVCHLGNPIEGKKDLAHKGMVKNPGELKHVNKTCGQSGCHSEEVKWVKNSLMATNRGIISTMMYYWGETNDHNIDISTEDLIKKGLNSTALDYFRKLCGSCHLWMEKNTLPDFLREKGGGCTACHYIPKTNEKGEKVHPFITRNIPMENCVRCHNRSGRIGLSYQGLYENEGYGTPYKNGKTGDNFLEDGRFYHRLIPDIHYSAGMVCIDCHTMKEVMGDGNRYAHLEEQLEVRCETCHTDNANLQKIYEERDNKKSQYPKISIEKIDNKFFIKGKNSNKNHPLNPPIDKCRDKHHKDMSCESCHSHWVPQCYGCHVKVDPSKRQLDKISNKETSPQWQEFRSFIRYEKPILGVSEKKGRKIVVLVPG